MLPASHWHIAITCSDLPSLSNQHFSVDFYWSLAVVKFLRDGCGVLHIGGVNQHPVLQQYSNNVRFMQGLARIKESGTDWMLFRLALFREIRSDRECIVKRQEAVRLESLGQVAGKRRLEQPTT